MSDPDLTIFCWILGDHFEHVFPVKISRNKVVCALKEAIKAETPRGLKDIDADTLILYNVSIPYSPKLADVVAASELDKSRLNPLDELSEVFANELPRKHIHVVVEVPQASGAWVYVVLSSLC
jgi:hypothetical protein